MKKIILVLLSSVLLLYLFPKEIVAQSDCRLGLKYIYKSKKEKCNIFYKKAVEARKNKNLPLMNCYVRKYLELAQKVDSMEVSKAYGLLGRYQLAQLSPEISKQELAITYYNLAIENHPTGHNSVYMLNYYSNLAIANKNLKRYDIAHGLWKNNIKLYLTDNCDSKYYKTYIGEYVKELEDNLNNPYRIPYYDSIETIDTLFKYKNILIDYSIMQGDTIYAISKIGRLVFLLAADGQLVKSDSLFNKGEYLIENYKQNLSNGKADDFYSSVGIFYHNKGGIYYNIDDAELMIFYYEKAIEFYLKSSTPDNKNFKTTL